MTGAAAMLPRVTVTRAGRVILHASDGDLRLAVESRAGAELALRGEREDRALAPAPKPIQPGAT